jgi:type IV pilus assembly protein PilN
MARINLLPWREERRKLRNRETQTLFAAAAVAALAAVFLAWWLIGQRIDSQNNRNTFLKDEITKIEAKIKEIEDLEKRKTQLLQRMQIIEQLQASRTLMVHLFDDLVRTIPVGVRLTSIKQTGNLLTMDGYAESNARVSEYMNKLEESQWVSEPDLAIVEAKGPDKRSRYQFTLRVKIKTPKGAAGADGEDAAAEGATT